MTATVQESVGKVQKILRVWEKITKRLPRTYPRASLVFHADEKRLMEYFFVFYECSDEERNNPPYAFCDANTNTVHVHTTMAECPIREIAGYLLHEIGHLRAFQKYGDNDPRAHDPNEKVDEAYACRFSSRWVSRLCKEGSLR